MISGRDICQANEAGGTKAELDKSNKDKRDGIDAAEKKLSSTGTFSASAVRGLGGGSAAERTAKATEKTAAGVEKLASRIESERFG